MKQLFLITALCAGSVLSANVKLPDIFSDHAVLQRSAATAVFGQADAGEKITVSYGDVKAQTVAGKNGKFLVKLDLSQAGNDAKELIVAGKNRVVVKDVIVGEVWFCSGQSNMALRLKDTLNSAAEIAKSANSRIRMFKPKMRTAPEVQKSIQGQWLVASPANSGFFTAVGYYFAKKLNQDAGLAVGLINPSWGGSTIESWICAEHIKKSTPAVREIAAVELDDYLNYQTKRMAYLPKLLAWEKSLGWIDDCASKQPPADAKWEKAPSLDAGIKGAGIFWLRREVNVTKKDIVNGQITVWLGRPNVAYKVFWDGKEIREISRARSLERRPERIFIKTAPGRHTLMLRVSATEALSRFLRENSISGKNTANGWDIAREKRFPEAGKKQLAARPSFIAVRPYENKTPSQIFNAMVYPLADFTIKGNLWYQGEGNAGRKGYIYDEHINALVKCFRDTFHDQKLPFYAVQLPDFGDKFTDPDFTGSWPTIRIRQSMALKKLPFAGEVIILNLGESKDIHPIDKKPVGERLAALALKHDYGKKEVICEYPEAVKAIRNQNRVRVRFVNCHGGLKAEKLPETYWVRRNKNQSAKLIPNNPGSQVEGFTLCGADGKWHWADAVIEGDEVIVSAAKVPVPVKVRYAFQNNPTCNLYNGAGLPAGTFELPVK